MMRKLGVLGLAVALVLAAIAAASLASGSSTSARTNAWGIPGLVPSAHTANLAPAITHGEEIVLVSRDGSETDVDEPPAGESQGDELAVHTPLFKGGARVGGLDVTAVETLADFKRHHAALQLTVTATLPAGAITSTGVFFIRSESSSTFTLAVTGGTGLYQNVRGEVHVQFISANAVKLTYHLVP